MAVQSDTSSISYTGNNSTTTSYAVPFVFLENAHLAATAKVTATGVETAVTLTNHTGAGDPNGGTVRTAVAVPATSTLNIFRTVPATQTTQYQEGGDFPAASHERALDKLTFISQQNERAVQRSFRVTEGSGTKNEVVAVPNTLLGLDNNNQPKALTVDQVKSLLSITGVTLDVDAGMKTFADAGERALNVPDFTGQLGTQRDTGVVYVSTGTSAGNWTIHAPAFGSQDITVSGADRSITNTGNFALAFGTNNTERVRINNSGNVGIGTTSPATQLEVAGNIRLSQATPTIELNSGGPQIYVPAASTMCFASGGGIGSPTERMRIASSGNVGIGKTSPTTELDVNGTITATTIVGSLKLATAAPTTSGVAIDFTGIPSWVKRITMMLNGVSTNGTSNLIIQLGTSGGLQTSAYGGAAMVSQAGIIGNTAFSTGFLIDATTLAADVRSGVVSINLVGNDVWAAAGNVSLVGAARTSCFSGTIGLSGTLTQVRITTVNGTDTFDAGTINISYEG
jgi:hypothetical protein